jgi:hypothetical protein
MSTPKEKVLCQRVRYHLGKEGQCLVVPRGQSPLGIHVVDSCTRAVVAHQCSIEKLAEELGIS